MLQKLDARNPAFVVQCYTMFVSNGIFKFNFLAVVVSEILGVLNLY